MAQLDLRLEMSKAAYLQYSPVPCTVRIRNLGAEPVNWTDAASEKPWLEMIVQAIDGLMVPPEKPLEISPPVLPPGGSAKIGLDLAPHYLVREPGGYQVRACVHLPSGQTLWTEPLTFLIGRGEVIWTVPRGEGRERRVFSLLKFFEDPNVGLYLRIEVPEKNLVFPSLRLGSYLPLGKPQAEFDSKNHLHVLHAVAAGSYRLTVVNPEGKILREESWQAGAGSPALRIDPDRQISVQGGSLILPSHLREQLSTLQARSGAVPDSR